MSASAAPAERSDLIADVEALIAEVLADPGLTALHTAAEAHATRLGEPLRVAVVGEVNAGKSTLVNALIGRRAAETSGGENTYVNWWFRHGSPERMALRRPGGAVDEVPLGSAIGDLDLASAAPVTVYCESPLLERLTVIDTPGLYSLRRDNSRQTEDLIALGRGQSVIGARQADALLYLTSSDLPGARDQDLLAGFTAAFGAVRVAPTNALMVLSRADRRADRRDATPPLEQAARLAARYRVDLFSCVWDIAPVSALGAFLARTDQIDGRAAAEVAHLAEVTREGGRRRLLADARYLRAELETRGLPRLLELVASGLDVYEARVLIEAADGGATAAPELARALEAASGLAPVEELLARTFGGRAELILADAALSAIEAGSYRARDEIPLREASRLRARCETIRMSATGLQDLADARTVLDPAVGFGLDEQAELLAVFTATPDTGGNGRPADAGERARYWMGRANAVSTTPRQRGVAMRAHRRYAETTTRRGG
ncbi:MAG: GTPase [Dehalococcoidia bacterium]